jgi:hypothetical protein
MAAAVILGLQKAPTAQDISQPINDRDQSPDV